MLSVYRFCFSPALLVEVAGVIVDVHMLSGFFSAR
jgi:hypothetical protein